MKNQGLALLVLALAGAWLWTQRRAEGAPAIPPLLPPEMEEARSQGFFLPEKQFLTPTFGVAETGEAQFIGAPAVVAPLPGAPFPAVPWIPLEPPVTLTPTSPTSPFTFGGGFGAAEEGEAQFFGG